MSSIHEKGRTLRYTHELSRFQGRLQVTGNALGVVAMGAALVLGVSTAISRPDMVEDGIYALSGMATDQESAINAAVKKAIGVDANFRCASIPERMHRPDVTAAAYVHPLPLNLGLTSLVRIDKRKCDAATAVADGATMFSSDQIDKTAYGMLTITHEAIHVGRDPRTPDGRPDEAATECIALSQNYKVAQALGAPEDFSYLLANRIIAMRAADVGLSASYKPTEECYNGGPLDLDLDPAAPAFFPVLPR